MLNAQKKQKRTHLPCGYICVPLVIHTYLIVQFTDYQPFTRNTPQKGWRGYSGSISFSRECDPKKFFAVIFGWFGVEMY